MRHVVFEVTIPGYGRWELPTEVPDEVTDGEIRDLAQRLQKRVRADPDALHKEIKESGNARFTPDGVSPLAETMWRLQA
jgi:hypothetical protein